MSYNTPISVNVSPHGTFTASAGLVDRAIAEYLPASPAQLRAIVAERTAEEFETSTVTECLIILASFYAENPF